VKGIRVLLADDHAILRAGLRMLIDAQPDMEVIAEAEDGQEAVRKAVESRADLVLMDLTMPGMSGIEAIEALRRARAATRVLVLTMHDDPAYARAALAAGAAGHLIKDVEGPELLAAIRAVHRGRTHVHYGRADAAGRSAAVPASLVKPAPTRPGAATLSERERQVLGLVAQGFTNREVAERLNLSVKTVETYRSRLIEKLGLHGRAELVRVALELGLFTATPGD
jgi:two-component system response regulator NreC